MADLQVIQKIPMRCDGPSNHQVPARVAVPLVVTSKGELCLPQYPNRSARPRDRGEGTGLYVKYLGMLLAFDSQEDTRLVE